MEGHRKAFSVALYKYLCLDMIGSEDYIRTARLLMHIHDVIRSEEEFATITSGSRGEGLQMHGSDVDVMSVIKNIVIVEKRIPIVFHETFHQSSILVAETYDVKPGFVHLRLLYSTDYIVLNSCKEFKKDHYLSNASFKNLFLGFVKVPSTIHGPCITDKYEITDFAFCLHSDIFITTARHWISRPNYGWPSSHVKKHIVDHGVLFVPIGIKGSKNEEFEWRTSFSVAEKFLIFSFTHTQLMCYVLMKILLKDIIEEDSKCKGLLCSYFIKTIIFWVSEETDPSDWIPCNLIMCFMKCFKRLVYCVEYDNCPHYFIPVNNLFEKKIGVNEHDMLLSRLNYLYDLGWNGLVSSSRLSNFQKHEKYSENNFIIKDLTQFKLLTSNMERFFTIQIDVEAVKVYKVVRNILSSDARLPRQWYLNFLCMVYQVVSKKILTTRVCGNKIEYTNYKTCRSLFLQSTYRDAVTGWFWLATLFYSWRQYDQALLLLEYTLLKCTPEMLNFGIQNTLSQIYSEEIQIILRLYRHSIPVVRYRFSDSIILTPSVAIHENLYHDIVSLPIAFIKIPPVVYGHYLSFLCHFSKRDARRYRRSIEDLKNILSEKYFVEDGYSASIGYFCLGVELQMVGDNNAAFGAFLTSILHNGIELSNPSFRRMFRLCNNHKQYR